ncbi:MAG: thiamine-phosphate kinase [Candidatus Melainabacteria bacterium RIFCSPLOWO2_02_FULL_35_15]|nr:MAG: thiamine-phosphate kinase [Candidatus Melainabacteria bacterium RIFCSPLOWO2_12_FULL_35_11]OGI13475.1 MAG: thiamine-phosphate kinase [Candidatus Melainabacteria bacterium RIFCSPLOWO2_02_FULL_35_15]
MPIEQEILKVIRNIVPNSRKYLFDDAAIIEKDLIITTDTLVENTHFTLKTYTAEEIGWKAMAVNLSDIAAMGGKPLYALISLSLPKNVKIKWIENFYKGLITCAKKYKTQIIGGNLARSREISVSITVIGKTVVKTLRRGISTRSNAKAGDLVFVTGTFGNAAAKNYKIKIFPQINLGQKIVRVEKHAPALMDASDGLADCLIQISNQSSVKIIIDEDKIPVLNKSPLNLALYGGEDYQLVGTASEADCKKLVKLKGIKIIGRVTNGKGAFLKQNDNRLVKLDLQKTYEHFIY